MVNLLTFRERATGDFEGRSGRDAYQQYARSVEAIQGPMGSKLLWSGDVEPAASEQPDFDVAAVLQYASPRSFLRFATRGGADSAARKAGLEGQWLIAAQTMDSAPWDVTDPTVLIELVGFGQDGQSWRDARREACTGLEGELIWRGRVIERVTGSGPRVDEIVITGFSDDAARTAGLEALSRVAGETGVEAWWTYQAQGNELMPGLRR